MRVHILYTGGTLGMIDTPAGLAPGADLTGWLDRLLTGTDLADEVTLSAFDHLIDSSNATPADWAAITATCGPTSRRPTDSWCCTAPTPCPTPRRR